MTRSLNVPARVKEHLDTLTRSLEGACGSNLASLCVYGSAVRGGFVEGTSDVDLVVVLHDTAHERLTALSEPLMLANHAVRAEAMVLRLNDLAPASDVFPLFYDDIKSCHALLSGTDVWKDVSVTDTHRRLRIEQELREAKIRMHRAVVDARGEDEALARFVSRKVTQIRSPLHALLTLQGTSCGESVEAVLDAFGKKAGVVTAPLKDVRTNPAAAHAAFRALIDAAIEATDRIEAK
ncbi:MAG: nucleotidyltransferase domain-containing protein [Vicinamibacteria bacterium]|nr:nucleotidyltransferase domain-containing protein [Vicinamibacteria bacterium]